MIITARRVSLARTRRDGTYPGTSNRRTTQRCGTLHGAFTRYTYRTIIVVVVIRRACECVGRQLRNARGDFVISRTHTRDARSTVSPCRLRVHTRVIRYNIIANHCEIDSTVLRGRDCSARMTIRSSAREIGAFSPTRRSFRIA